MRERLVVVVTLTIGGVNDARDGQAVVHLKLLQSCRRFSTHDAVDHSCVVAQCAKPFFNLLNGSW